MNKVDISIVMPVYNAGKYLNDAISDILDQTYKCFELICVDDGSTDQSSEILDNFAEKDDRIKVITQDNQGAGAARNRGMDEAQGKYIVFFDADDRFNRNLLKYTIDEAEKYNTDILVFDVYYEDEQGCQAPTDHIVHKNWLPSKEAFNWRDCEDRILDIFFHVVWNKIYLREFLVKHKIRFQNTIYMNDVFFHHTSMIEAERICYFDRKLLTYRFNREGSITGKDTFAKAPEIACCVTDSIIEYLKNKGIYNRVKCGLISNAVLRLSGLLETAESEIFKIMYPLYRDYLKNALEATCICELDWVEEWKQDWVNALLSLSERDFIFWIFDNYRRRNLDLSNIVRLQDKEILKAYKELSILIKNKHWTYDSKIFKGRERIVIYAAGEVGTDFVIQLLREDKLELVAWVDRDYLRSDNGIWEISSPEVIRDLQFDHIIIAIRDQNTAEIVREEISSYVQRDKILLMKDVLRGDMYEQD